MNEQKLKRLIQLGKERGYLTSDEIREAFPVVADAQEIRAAIAKGFVRTAPER